MREPTIILQWHPMAEAMRRNPDSRLLKVIRSGIIVAALLALIEGIRLFGWGLHK